MSWGLLGSLTVAVAVLLCTAATATAAEDQPASHNLHRGSGSLWDQLMHGLRDLEKVTAHRVNTMVPVVSVGGSSMLLREGDHDQADADAAEVEAVPVGLPEYSDEEEDDDASAERNYPFGFSFFRDMDFPSGVAWWKGPNVCVEREEIELNIPALQQQEAESEDEEKEADIVQSGIMTSGFHFSSCVQTSTTYKCRTHVNNNGARKTLITRHRCCHGTHRVAGQSGCAPVSNATLMDMATKLGGRLFADMASSARINWDFGHPVNKTLFLPIDQTMREAQNQRDLDGAAALSALTEAHHVNGHVLDDPAPSAIGNEMILQTLKPDATIRINVYPGVGGPETDFASAALAASSGRTRTITANCGRILKLNTAAAGGDVTVHLVDRLLRPVLNSHTIAAIVENDPQFSATKTLLANSGLMHVLREAGPFTLFAFANDGLKDLAEKDLETLYGRRGCSWAAAQNLIVRHTMCSASLTPSPSPAAGSGGGSGSGSGSGRPMHLHMINMIGEDVKMERRADGKLYVNGVQIIAKDIMASNGVIHVMEKFVLPEIARPIEHRLTKDAARWWHLIKDTAQAGTLESMWNATVLVPSQEAINRAKSAGIIATNTKVDILRTGSLVAYHMAAPAVAGSKFVNGQQLVTPLEGRSAPLGVHRFKTEIPLVGSLWEAPTIQCAKLVSEGQRSCGTVMYRIDRVLIPSKKTIMDLLESNDFSVLRGIIDRSSYKSQLSGAAHSNVPHVTFLAPTNKAFGNANSEAVQNLMQDKQLADSFLQRHIIPQIVCCSGIGKTSWPFYSAISTMKHKFSLQVRRDDLKKRPMFGDAVAIECDKAASNGIVHVVEKLTAQLPKKHDLAVKDKVFTVKSTEKPNVMAFLFGNAG